MTGPTEPLFVGIIRGSYRDVDDSDVTEENREVELVSIVDDISRGWPVDIDEAQWVEFCDLFHTEPKQGRPFPWHSKQAS